MSKKHILFIVIIILFFLPIFVLNQIFAFFNFNNTKCAINNKSCSYASQDKLFVIEKGQGVKEISKNLKENGFIKNCFIFETYVWLKKQENKFQAGEYVLNISMSIFKITEILTSGKVMSQEREIKIIEGWSADDIGDYLEQEKILAKKQFLAAVNDRSIKSEYQFLSIIPEGKNLEGFLFPDTYRIYKSAIAEDVAHKMLNEFDKKLSPQMREDIKNQGKNIYDIIIMASIIQKEVAKTEDMNIVSDIFWKRFDAGMPLQSCATIAYILGENKPQYSYEDTRIESPYNTYLNRGLPPTPICNPGFSAIKAAIYPLSNDYWYFLSKSENGETVFSKTLDEHNINKAKYLD